jgi:hypothetical protein
LRKIDDSKAILEPAKFIIRVDTPTCEASHELVAIPSALKVKLELQFPMADSCFYIPSP